MALFSRCLLVLVLEKSEVSLTGSVVYYKAILTGSTYWVSNKFDNLKCTTSFYSINIRALWPETDS